MAGHTTTNTDHLTRSHVWSAQLQQIVLSQLFGQNYVNWLKDFPDGDTFHIPVIGQMEAKNYQEDNPVDYEQMDTGDFTFSVTEYISAATYITNKAKQDLFYAQQLIGQFVPNQHRALMVRVENDIFRIGPESQTAADPNAINGVAHRWVGTGKSGASSNNTIALEDFARARLALEQANMPMSNLVAFVDPSVEFTLNTLTNLTNVSYNPRWEGVITSGLANGMTFKVNIYGFDVYISQHLKNGISDTVYARAVTNGVANCFFSATPGLMPIVGAVRQPPKVDSKYNQDRQREEYVTTMRYGMKLQRPDNFVCVLTDNTISAPSYA